MFSGRQQERGDRVGRDDYVAQCGLKMLVVMADESGYSGDGYFAIAGYVAEHESWNIFDRLWNSVLRRHDLHHFHMKDFAHFKGPFARWDESRRRSLMGDLLEVITAGPLIAIGACLRISDFTRLEDKAQKGLVGPYMCCFQEMLLGIGMSGAIHGYPLSNIDLVYSHQDDFKKKMRSHWEFARGFREYGPALGVIEFQDMRTVPGLQAADLLVYEFRHFYHLKDMRPGLSMRVPFRSLISHQQELHSKTLKYLPGWYLEFQAKGISEEAMNIIAFDDVWDHMYQELNPAL
jgi:hypothetical protein